ncbi:hypothetical protein ALC53_08439, partial [Atta colombica]
KYIPDVQYTYFAITYDEGSNEPTITFLGSRDCSQFLQARLEQSAITTNNVTLHTSLTYQFKIIAAVMMIYLSHFKAGGTRCFYFLIKTFFKYVENTSIPKKTLCYIYLPDPQTTKRNRAKSQGPTGDPSSCDF